MKKLALIFTLLSANFAGAQSSKAIDKSTPILSYHTLSGMLSTDIETSWEKLVVCDSSLIKHELTHLQIKQEPSKTSFFCIPEIDDEVVVGFFNKYRPQFSVAASIAKALSMPDFIAADLLRVVDDSVYYSIQKNEPLNLVGFGSFSVSKIIDHSFDYEFVLNRSVAKSLFATGVLQFDAVALPSGLVDAVGEYLDASFAKTKHSPAKVASIVLGYMIAGRVGVDFSQKGSVSSYLKASNAAGKAQCRDTNPGAMHFHTQYANYPVGLEVEAKKFSLELTNSLNGDSCRTTSLVIPSLGDVVQLLAKVPPSDIKSFYSAGSEFFALRWDPGEYSPSSVVALAMGDDLVFAITGVPQEWLSSLLESIQDESRAFFASYGEPSYGGILQSMNVRHDLALRALRAVKK